MDTAAAVAGIPIGRRSCLPTRSVPPSAASRASFGLSAISARPRSAFDLDSRFRCSHRDHRRIGKPAGNFLGAAFIVLTPLVLDLSVVGLGLDDVIDHGTVTNVLHIIFGAIIILLLIKEPDGLASLPADSSG